MEARPVINIVGSQCQPDVEAEFNRWYDETHIPMLLKFKGLNGVKRYKILNPDSDYPQYLNIYEFASRADYEAYERSPELAAVRQEMKETWGERGGWEMKWRVQYEFMGEWRK